MPPLALTVVGIVVILSLLAVSAFFSSSEIALFSLSEQTITDLDRESDSRVDVLRELTADPHRLLVTLLVGNNVVNLAIGSITTVLVLEYVPPGMAVGLATVLASGLVLVFGEIVPKSYGLGNAQAWSLTVVGPLRTVGRVLSPLIVVFEWITSGINRLVGGQSDIEKPYLSTGSGPK